MTISVTRKKGELSVRTNGGDDPAVQLNSPKDGPTEVTIDGVATLTIQAGVTGTVVFDVETRHPSSGLPR